MFPVSRYAVTASLSFLFTITLSFPCIENIDPHRGSQMIQIRGFAWSHGEAKMTSVFLVWRVRRDAGTGSGCRSHGKGKPRWGRGASICGLDGEFITFCISTFSKYEGVQFLVHVTHACNNHHTVSTRSIRRHAIRRHAHIISSPAVAPDNC